MPTPLQTIDRNAAKLIRSNLELALISALKDLGVTCDIGSIRFSDRRATCSLTFAIADPTGKSQKIVQAEADWAQYHQLFDLKKEWLHGTFSSNGKTFRIAGLMPSRPKNALLADEVDASGKTTGKRFVFPPESIVPKMEAKDAAASVIQSVARKATKS